MRYGRLEAASSVVLQYATLLRRRGLRSSQEIAFENRKQE